MEERIYHRRATIIAKNFAQIANGLVTGVLCLLMAYAIYTYWNEFRGLTKISTALAAAILCFGFVWNATQALILRASLKPFHVHMDIWESIGVTYAAYFSNIFMPFSGLGVRGFYLKRVHKLNLKAFAVAVAGPIVVELFVYAMGGFFALLTMPGRTYLADLLTLFFFAVIAIAVASIFISARAIPRWIPFRDRVLSVINDWRVFSGDRKVFAEIFLLTIINFASAVALYKLASHAAAAPDNGLAAVVVAALSEFSYLIRVTPAGIGTLEGSVALAGKVIGFTLAQSLVVATLVRLASVFWYLLLGGAYWRELIRRCGNAARTDLT